MKKSPHLYFFQKIRARRMFLLFYPIASCAVSDFVRVPPELTLSSKTVAFLDITCHVLLIRSCISLLKTHKILFLWFYRPTQKDIFFSCFIFQLKTESIVAPLKEMTRNAKHTICWLGLNDILEVQRSLANPRYEEFSSLCGVLKYDCIYNPAWDTPGRRRG